MNTTTANPTQVTFKHTFKTVRKAGDPRHGQKRDAITVTFDKPVLADIPEQQVQTILQDSLTLFAKKLIAQNESDWDYIPAPSEITVAKLYDDLTSPSARGTRILTKTNIGLWRHWFDSAGAEILRAQGRSAGFIGTISGLVEEQFKSLYTAKDKISIVLGVFENAALIDAMADLPSEDEIIITVHQSLMDKLIEIRDSEKEVREINLANLE